jgi:hypothetical protein
MTNMSKSSSQRDQSGHRITDKICTVLCSSSAEPSRGDRIAYLDDLMKSRDAIRNKIDDVMLDGLPYRERTIGKLRLVIWSAIWSGLTRKSAMSKGTVAQRRTPGREPRIWHRPSCRPVQLRPGLLRCAILPARSGSRLSSAP